MLLDSRSGHHKSCTKGVCGENGAAALHTSPIDEPTRRKQLLATTAFAADSQEGAKWKRTDQSIRRAPVSVRSTRSGYKQTAVHHLGKGLRHTNSVPDTTLGRLEPRETSAE